MGPENAGKSTILNQFKINHESGYSQDECLQYRPVVYSNTIQSMIAILRDMGKLEIDFGHPDREDEAKQFLALAAETPDQVDLWGELADVMKRLWKDSGVQECVSRSREYQLNASAEYFLNALDRLSVPNYAPTERDVLLTKGTGPRKLDFTFKNLHFEIYNLGSQIGKREKLLHYFENFTVILFVTDMSVYDVTINNFGMNGITESLKIFGSIFNNKWLADSTITCS